MQQQIKNQKIKISRKPVDWIIEFTGIVFCIILIVLPLIYISQLPEKIPTHFNLAGEPDDYGNKLTIWLLPAIGFIMYLGMTILESYPHIYNYPVEITQENIVQQYTIGTRLVRILKIVVVIIFSFINYQTINTALGKAVGLGKAFLPVSLLLVFGGLIIYLVVSKNNQYKKDKI